MNYTELTAAIKAYAENDFPTTAGSGGLTSTQQTDRFIREAEQRVYNSVQILDLRKTATPTCVVGTKTLTLPGDWLSTYDIAVIDTGTGDYEYLLNKDVSFIRASFPNPATQGKPTHYALSDDTTLLLGPTPDATYTLEHHYFYYPPSIVDAATSWLGTNFDSVLLYGALLEAYTFMKGEGDVMTAYQTRYDDALAKLKTLAEGKNRQDQYRSGQNRVPVR